MTPNLTPQERYRFATWAADRARASIEMGKRAENTEAAAAASAVAERYLSVAELLKDEVTA